MTRRYIAAVMLILFTLFSSQVLYSALNDFKHDYEKEEKSKSGKSKSAGSGTGKSKSKGYSSDSGDDGCASLLGEMLGELIWEACISPLVYLWVDLNCELEYSKYPYYDTEKSNFICNYIISSKKQDDSKPEIIDISMPDSSQGKGCFDGKSWFLTIEGGGQNAYDNGKGGFGRISGKIFKLLGPELEAKRLVDKNDDYLDYYAMGVNIPIVQFSGFMPDFYVQAAFLRGVIERDGVSYGIIINSYPVRPLSLMVRFGRQSYGNIKGQEYGNMKFYDYEGRIGIIFNRFEIFAGYRNMEALYAEIRGPVAGVKIFF